MKHRWERIGFVHTRAVMPIRCSDGTVIDMVPSRNTEVSHVHVCVRCEQEVTTLVGKDVDETDERTVLPCDEAMIGSVMNS